ncbi:sideroflexin-1-3-like [Lycorma delicatula]|uniref:sideroflexin-1-3-like n=1 Tax=Lycorma delicatula TaxID=130591 RepID=UPI003F518B05
MANLPRVDITKPKWDQSTYIGRAKHFFVLTNPLNILATSSQLNHAKEIYDNYRAGKSLQSGTTMDDVWRAKYLYDSAFHPDTGEKMLLIGRMAAQMPLNTFITAGMMTFYKSNAAVTFWQWFNQSCMALVNYTNRSGDEPITLQQLGISYVLATGGALVTALTLNRQAKKFPPIIGRWVPFVAIAAANCINIPCMRMREVREGVVIFDSNNNRLGNSKKAAREGIIAVICSRVSMAIPTMIAIPILVDRLEKRGTFKTFPRGPVVVNTVMCAVILTFSTPLGCAIFSQTVPVKLDRLEKNIQEAAKKLSLPPTIGYYNKGL